MQNDYSLIHGGSRTEDDYSLATIMGLNIGALASILVLTLTT